MRKLKKYKTPTDVFIIGADFDDRTETFSITDDYCNCIVKLGEKKFWLETVGYVFIYSKKELEENLEFLMEDEWNEDCVLIKDFVGEINLTGDYEGKNVPLNYVDLTDYVSSQTDAGGWVELTINCEGTYSSAKTFLLDNLEKIL